MLKDPRFYVYLFLVSIDLRVKLLLVEGFTQRILRRQRPTQETDQELLEEVLAAYLLRLTDRKGIDVE